MFENKPLLYPDERRKISPGWQWTLATLYLFAFGLKAIKPHNVIDEVSATIAAAITAVAIVLYYFKKIENLSAICGILFIVCWVVDALFIS